LKILNFHYLLWLLGRGVSSLTILQEVIRMDELVRIKYENDRPTVLGRDLHEVLEVKTAYKDWFPRMCEYGFVEGTDFSSFLSESTGGRPSMDHQLTIDMAKELCMIQRTLLTWECWSRILCRA